MSNQQPTSTFLGIAAVGALAAGMNASAALTVIDFDGFAGGTIITNQHPEATFSSSAGDDNKVLPFPINDTPPNILCTGPVGGSVNCVAPTFIDFTDPVDRLTFYAIGVNDVGHVADVNVFVSNVFNSTVQVIGAGTIKVNILIDLSAFTNVTRIELTNITDFAGIGWDTFSFNVIPAADCSGFPCGNNDQKVLLCHVPPGNPDNEHTICISPNAVAAHLENHEGDHCGPCDDDGLSLVGSRAAAFCPADITADGVVNVLDLIQLLLAFGDPGGPADINGDGTVNVIDLIDLLLKFGTACP